MKVFNIKSIREEIGKIVWPKQKEMVEYTITVLSFIAFFAFYFLITELIISQFLKLVKVF